MKVFPNTITVTAVHAQYGSVLYTEEEHSMERFSRGIQIEVLDVQDEREHCHQEIELLYVLEGSLDVSSPNEHRHMGEEDILVINSNKYHQVRASEDILYAKFLIRYNVLEDMFQRQGIIFWCDSTKNDCERFEELRAALKLLLRYQGKNQMDFGYLTLSYRILDILTGNFLVRTADEQLSVRDSRFEQRIRQITHYIQANYMHQISLKELAEQLYLSEAYLSRFFKKYYGVNFREYLSNIRLHHAMDMLFYSDWPITRIAHENGFPNADAFTKSVRRVYGEPPAALRRRGGKSGVQNLSQKEENTEAEQRLEALLQANPCVKNQKARKISLSAECHVQETQRLPPVWQNIINAGDAEYLLQADAQSQLLLLKKRMHFQYVRFWGIFPPMS